MTTSSVSEILIHGQGWDEQRKEIAYQAVAKGSKMGKSLIFLRAHSLTRSRRQKLWCAHADALLGKGRMHGSMSSSLCPMIPSKSLSNTPLPLIVQLDKGKSMSPLICREP